MEERLQKVMAHAGVASRRTCEELILQGRVRVNGKVVSELGSKVDPERDIVLVDGNPITGPEAPRYIVLYKPPGYLSAMEPEGGRPCLADLLQVPQRLYPVGRLDLESEGLMLLTNDGELAHRLTHPRYQHPKEYLVLIEGRPSTVALRKLRQGVDVADRLTAPAEVTIIDGPPAYLARPTDARPIPTTWLHMVLREGRKREIRHMTAAVGHPTLRLIRVGLGPLRLEHVRMGAWRDVNARELRALRRLLRPAAGPAPRHPDARRDEPSRGRGRPPRAGQAADQGARSAGGKPSRTHPGRSQPGDRTRPGRTQPDERTRPGRSQADERTRPGHPQADERTRAGRRQPGAQARPAAARPSERGGPPPDHRARGQDPAPRGPHGTRRGPAGRPPRGPSADARRDDRPAATRDRPPGAGTRPTARSGRPAGRGGRPTGSADRPSGPSRGGRPSHRSGKKRPPV